MGWIDGNFRAGCCALLALSIVLTGCAHRHGEVGMQRMDPDSVPHEEGRSLVLQSQEAFAMPELPAAADRTESPEYPQFLLKDKLPPVTLCVDVVVDEQGNVPTVDPLTHIGKCASLQAPGYDAFFEAVSRAVKQWRFLPALVCKFPAGQTPDPQKCRAKDATQSGIEVKTIAVTLTYRFDFRQVDGRAVVRRTSG